MILTTYLRTIKTEKPELQTVILQNNVMLSEKGGLKDFTHVCVHLKQTFSKLITLT